MKITSLILEALYRRNQKLKTFGILTGLITGMPLAAFAQPASTTPGYLADYQYQVSSITAAEAQAAMDIEAETKTTKKSICANRAEFWAFKINQRQHIQLGKV